MKRNSKITSLFVAAILVCACSKDFLDKPVANQLAVDQFYKTDDQCEQALRSVYDILQWTYNTSGYTGSWTLRNYPSDETSAGGANAGDQPAIVALDELNFDANNDVVEGAWLQDFYGVYRANLVVNNVDASASDKKRQIVAEAKCLRAYYYFDLVSLFGGVPLVLDELTPDQYNQSRASVADVYAQIEKDLNEAIPDLPLKSELNTADRYKVTKGTAYSILGKAYLYQEKWSDAVDAFSTVISSGEYHLDPSYAHLFTKDGEFGSGSILEASYTNKASYDWGNFPWDDSRNVESNIITQLTGAREGSFSGADSLLPGWGFNYPTKKLYDAFVSEGDTVRRKATVISQAEYEARGGTVSDPNTFDYNGYILTKYTTIASESGGSVAALNYGTNWRLIRYADVLLMAAEAYYHNGNEPQALIELNKVRQRANLTDVAVTGNALFEAIVKERQLELAIEGHRYLDLIRWGKAAQEITGFTTGKNELFPIPQKEILKAPALAPNNPGW